MNYWGKWIPYQLVDKCPREVETFHIECLLGPGNQEDTAYNVCD